MAGKSDSMVKLITSSEKHGVRLRLLWLLGGVKYTWPQPTLKLLPQLN